MASAILHKQDLTVFLAAHDRQAPTVTNRSKVSVIPEPLFTGKGELLASTVSAQVWTRRPGIV